MKSNYQLQCLIYGGPNSFYMVHKGTFPLKHSAPLRSNKFLNHHIFFNYDYNLLLIKFKKIYSTGF